MIEILTLLIFNSLLCVGIHISTNEGNINHWVEKATKGWSKFITRPLYGCPTCMASIHSAYIYWAYCDNILLYVPYIFALSALNTIFYRLSE